MPFTRLHRTVLLAFVVFLGGCQTIPDQPSGAGIEWLQDDAPFTVPLDDHAKLSGWQFSGKVAVKSPEVNESANIVWRFADQANSVRLFGPLGAGAIKLDFDRYGVQLSDSKGLLHRGNNAEELLTEIVGWPIPIDALTYWLFGLPNPAQAYEYQTNEAGLVTTMKQAGWNISYSAHQDYPPREGSLARKLLAQKELPNDQVLTVKIVTKAWQW